MKEPFLDIRIQPPALVLDFCAGPVWRKLTSRIPSPTALATLSTKRESIGTQEQSSDPVL